MEDKAGNLWLSVVDIQGNGMTAYRYDGKSFTKILKKAERDDGQVFRILEDKGGNLWIGTMKGVLRYDGKAFASFTE
jgi:ligand-binding sensor domain-containing protein